VQPAIHSFNVSKGFKKSSPLETRDSRRSCHSLDLADEDLIKATKIAAIEDGRNVSGIVQELLEAWLAGRKTRK
jgi:hypothetical protein